MLMMLMIFSHCSFAQVTENKKLWEDKDRIEIRKNNQEKPLYANNEKIKSSSDEEEVASISDPIVIKTSNKISLEVKFDLDIKGSNDYSEKYYSDVVVKKSIRNNEINIDKKIKKLIETMPKFDRQKFEAWIDNNRDVQGEDADYSLFIEAQEQEDYFIIRKILKPKVDMDSDITLETNLYFKDPVKLIRKSSGGSGFLFFKNRSDLFIILENYQSDGYCGTNSIRDLIVYDANLKRGVYKIRAVKKDAKDNDILPIYNDNNLFVKAITGEREFLYSAIKHANVPEKLYSDISKKWEFHAKQNAAFFAILIETIPDSKLKKIGVKQVFNIDFYQVDCSVTGNHCSLRRIYNTSWGTGDLETCD